jgi:hypothetical protein
MVEPERLEQYRLANAELSRRVRLALEQFFLSLDLTRPELARDALLAFTPTLVERYGAVAAALAADWYEELRAVSGAAGAFQASLAPTVPADAVTAQVRYLAKHLWTPTPEAIIGPLLTSADKYVKQPGRDTMAANARRENVSWARVPTGEQTCAFCLVLASRDAVYATRASAGDSDGTGVGDDYHGDCDCQVVRISGPNDYPEGYLPDNYFNLYQDALDSRNDPEVRAFLDSLDPDDKNRMLKATVFAMRRNNPDVVRDGVHTH